MSIITTIKLSSNVTVVFEKGNNGNRGLVSVFVNDFESLTLNDFESFKSSLGAYRSLNHSVKLLRLQGRMTLKFLRVTALA